MAVGAEGDPLHLISMADQPCDQLSGRDAPDPDGPVTARGGKKLLVRAEGDAVDGTCVRFCIPDLHRPILARGSETAPVRAEFDIEYLVLVTVELKQLLPLDADALARAALLRIPDHHRPVLAGGCQAAPVSIEGDLADRSCMTPQRLKMFPGFPIPQVCHVVAVTSREQLSVSAEGHRIDQHFACAFQDERNRRPRADIPNRLPTGADVRRSQSAVVARSGQGEVDETPVVMLSEGLSGCVHRRAEDGDAGRDVPEHDRPLVPAFCCASCCQKILRPERESGYARMLHGIGGALFVACLNVPQAHGSAAVTSYERAVGSEGDGLDVGGVFDGLRWIPARLDIPDA